MKESVCQDIQMWINVDQLRGMLGGVGYKAAYGLLYDGSIVVLGKEFESSTMAPGKHIAIS